MGNIFDTILINPLLNLLVGFYQLISFVHVPFALGFSIISLTVFTRLILYPFTHAQMKAQKKMQELQPHLNKIKEKHKNDMKQQQAAQMALYQQHGVNPAAGCLPLLIQFPVLIGLYQVLFRIVHYKSVNDINHVLYFSNLKLMHLWDTTFFGLPLSQTPAQLLPKVGVAIFLISIVTAVLQMLQSKMMMPAAGAALAVSKSEPKKEDDFATTFQKQSMYLIPIMVGFFAYSFPVGLSLYWNTLTIFGIIQQYRVSGWGSLSEWFPKLK